MSAIISQIMAFRLLLLFRRRSEKSSKLRVTGLCEGNSPVTGEFSSQSASNAENVFIWWRHHHYVHGSCFAVFCCDEDSVISFRVIMRLPQYRPCNLEDTKKNNIMWISYGIKLYRKADSFWRQLCRQKLSLWVTIKLYSWRFSVFSSVFAVYPQDMWPFLLLVWRRRTRPVYFRIQSSNLNINHLASFSQSGGRPI